MKVSRVADVALLAGSLSFTILLIEAAARLYLWGAGISLHPHYDLAASRPPPYRDAPYFSKQFLDEAVSQPGGWYTPPGTGILVPKDYLGRYFRINNGRRATLGQPDPFLQRVLLIGGSTVYNSEVPDEYTIATQLQRKLEARFPGRFRVENYGATSANVRQELERLKLARVDSGDVVILYNGVNDIAQGVFNQAPLGTIVGSNRETVADLPLIHRALLSLYFRGRDYSAFVNYFLDPVRRGSPPHLADPERVNELVRLTAGNYFRTILAADDYANDQGARFLHFFQPHLFSDEVMSQYETKLTADPRLIHPGMDIAFRSATPAMQKVTDRLRTRGVDSRDLSSLLNARSPGQEFFLDYCHVTHEANARIASVIAAAVAAL